MDDNDIPRARTDWEHLIDEWIFSERDRKILKSRLLDGLTYEQLEEKYALSARQLARIIPRLKEQLFKHI